MHALAKMGDESSDLLVQVFPEEPSADQRAHFYSYVAGLPDKKVARKLLKSASTDADAGVRLQAVRALPGLGADIKEALEAFVLLMKDSDPEVRTQAAYVALTFGKKSHGPLAAALPAAKDSRHRTAVLYGMDTTKYASKTAVPDLIECLKDQDLSVQQLTCNVFARIGPDAKAALPALRTLIANSENPDLRALAASAVKAIETKK
jgi:HEAT repeat protein